MVKNGQEKKKIGKEKGGKIMEESPIIVAIAIVIMMLICMVYWLAGADTQSWLQNKYYKFRMWRIKRKNKKNEWKWGDEIEWK